MPKKAKTSSRNSMPFADFGLTPDRDTPFGMLMAWNSEITRFYLSRYQQYSYLPSRMMECQSPADFEALRADFMQKLEEDYREEAENLAAIIGAGSSFNIGDADDARARSLLQAQEEAAAILDQAKAQAERILAKAEQKANATQAKTRAPAKKSA